VYVSVKEKVMSKKISQVVESVDEKLDILFGDITKKFGVILEKAGCQAEVEESESESPDGTGWDKNPKNVKVKATKFGDKEKGKKSKADEAGFDGSEDAEGETYDAASKDVVRKDKNSSKVEVKECDQVSDETYDKASKDVVRKDKNKATVEVKEEDEECEAGEAEAEEKEEVDESNNGGYGTDGQKEGDAEPTADEFEGNLTKGKKAGFAKDVKPRTKGEETPKNSKESNSKTGTDLANAKGTKGQDTPKNSKESNGKAGTDLAAQKGAKGEETPKNPKETNFKADPRIVASEGAMSKNDVSALVKKIAEKLKKLKKPSDVMPAFKSIVAEFEQDKGLTEKQIYTLRAIDKQLV
jgi:hypothetical protein